MISPLGNLHKYYLVPDTRRVLLDETSFKKRSKIFEKPHACFKIFDAIILRSHLVKHRVTARGRHGRFLRQVAGYDHAVQNECDH